MKNAKQIYTLIQVMLLFIGIGIIIGFAGLLLTVFGVESSLSVFPVRDFLGDHTSEILLPLFLLIAVYSVWIYGLFKLRIAIKNVMKEKYFAEAVTINFSLAGKAFVIAAVFHWFFTGMAQFLLKNEFSENLGAKTIVYLFAITVGLLLMLLSEVLSNARSIQEENDLTI